MRTSRPCPRAFSLFAVFAAAAAPLAADAAVLDGVVADSGGTGLTGLEVRLWAETADKRWGIAYLVNTDGAGYFVFPDVAPGDYKLDARMAPGVSGNWTDRWYDVADPVSGGWIGEDADLISISSDGIYNGYNLTLEQGGGIDVRVLGDGTPLAGIQARFERTAEPRIHHDDTTRSEMGPGDTSNWGWFNMRGLVPEFDYRLLLHDPNAFRETLALPGPYTVTPGVDVPLGDVGLPGMTADPYEPNNWSGDAGSAVDMSALLAGGQWVSAGAYVGPRNADIDWFCWDAPRGDHYILQTQSDVPLPDSLRDSPWVDPMLSFWGDGGATLLSWDDDSASGHFDSYLDTGLLASAGRYCAAVTTYGDSTWAGTNQQSAGRYVLSIDMGNRAPYIVIDRDGVPAPLPPDVLSVDEGAVLVLHVTYADPDGDALPFEWSHTDVSGATVLDSTLPAADGAGEFRWNIDERAADLSPYTLVVRTTDGEFTAEAVVTIQINAVNNAPTTPVLISPEDHSVVVVEEPVFTVQNSTDPDGDSLGYEFELYLGATDGLPAQAGSVPGDPSGTTDWTPGAVEENADYFWRARAVDGQPVNGTSPWTDFWTFHVDTRNDLPPAPVLLKPSEGEELLVRRPAFEATNVEDPEMEDVSIWFEVARDSAFTDVVSTSDPIAQDTGSSTTVWTIDLALDWGATYYARAFAVDARDGVSPPSNVNSFRIQVNDPPSTPQFGAPFLVQCSGLTLDSVIPQSVEVSLVVDPEAASVEIQVQVFDFDEDPETAAPLYDVTMPQDVRLGSTRFAIPAGVFLENGHYRIRVRATDGEVTSAWTECDMWVDLENSAPRALTIVSPEEGTIYPYGTQQTDVVVTGLSDPDFGFRGTTLGIAWCYSRDENWLGCDPDPALWTYLPVAEPDPTANIPLTIEGLANGDRVWVEVCAIDETGTCGAVDTTSFTVSKTITSGTGYGCGCSQGSGSRGSAAGVALLAMAAALTRRRRQA